MEDSKEIRMWAEFKKRFCTTVEADPYEPNYGIIELNENVKAHELWLWFWGVIEDQTNRVQPEVIAKTAEEIEKEYNELFDKLNKNFTAYNWFINTHPNDDEAKKRWDNIREIISRFML